MISLILALSVTPAQRIDYAEHYHEHFLPDRKKNELAGTSGSESRTLWITSPRCSQRWLEEIVQNHGDDMRELEFITVECWERKANTPPFEVKLFSGK